MKTRSLLRKLASYFPKRLRDDYDFGGLMCGKLKEETNKILICLDFDDQIFEKAIAFQPDLILTHHPFIYGRKSSVLKNDPIKKDLYERIEKANLCVYSMHTNFDAGKGGMNDALANRLELIDIKSLEGAPMARGGYLKKPLDIKKFAKYAKEKFDVPYSLLINEGKKEIRSVAIIGGGGWRENEIAQKEGYDIYISGDIPHHARREIVLRHYNYLDMPHEIEKIFMPTMKNLLLSFSEEFEILCLDHEKLPELI